MTIGKLLFVGVFVIIILDLMFFEVIGIDILRVTRAKHRSSLPNNFQYNIFVKYFVFLMFKKLEYIIHVNSHYLVHCTIKNVFDCGQDISYIIFVSETFNLIAI